ncbi:MAG: ATPase, T2SS/T4P/T4SS family [Phycisphaerae bacterium]|jgi:pilus assembly protein CpaF|nr:ATPase, T2SS/T4P/T4SS family [Phycisphaerae bacterium]
MDESKTKLAAEEGREVSEQMVFEETIRHFLEPVRAFLEDPEVVEIMCNGPNEIYVERKGKLELTDAKFENEERMIAAMRNILQFVGKRLNPDLPLQDARLPDGSRVHIAMPPCSRVGPCLTIRKFVRKAFDMGFLVQSRTLSEMARDFLQLCVLSEKNLLISGGTSSGKTSLMNVLTGYVPADRRIVVIEESSELQLQQPHVISLETRGPDRYGRGAVPIRMLFKHSLRMRPDRIIVGEVRGGEAMDMIQAMTSGHGGSMSTLHADSATDTILRLETLAMMGGVDMPLHALRARIASAIDIVVQMMRFADGSRRVVQISEVLPLDKGEYRLQDMFELRMPPGARKLIDADLVWSGRKPSFADDVPTKLLAESLPSLGEMFADTSGEQQGE